MAAVAVYGVQSAIAQQRTASGLADADLITLDYEVTNRGEHLVITPHLAYRDLYLKGGPVPGLPTLGAPFIWAFPGVSIKMTNNTTDVLALSSATVRSKSSSALLTPLLIWDDLSYAQLVIRNEGWSGVSNAQLGIDIATESACKGWPEASSYARQIPLPDFDEGTKIPLLQYVPSRYRKDEKVCVFGEISYQDNMPGGTTHRVKYKTRAYLAIRSTAGMPPSNFYQVMLHAGRPGEVVHVPLEQQLPPKAADHFVIMIGSDKSATFQTEVTVHAVSGKLVKKQLVDIETFVPRTEAQRVQASN
ncbi:MAG TPA: hypothetical protein VJV79_10085 [Polyangiaceae bacterium]|nr:hypothetical protein [Polyangiaceae bacterium]